MISLVQSHRVCVLSRVLYSRLFNIDASKFPGDWLYQLGKCVLSIGSNYCEGYGRRGTEKSPYQFMRMARASAYEAAFQFNAVNMGAEQSIASMISDIMDRAIDSRLFDDLESCADPFDVLAASAPDHGLVGEPLKTAVAPWVGTATPGQSMGREALHLVPSSEPSANTKAPGNDDVGRPADRNLGPSGSESTDASQDEGAPAWSPDGGSGLPLPVSASERLVP